MKPDQSSNTALIVAAGLLLVRPLPAYAHALPDEAIRRSAALLRVAQPRLAGLLAHGWFRAACRALEKITLPGILLHFALRKRALREHARAAIAAGCRQVVVLGAGLDTLCLELQAEYPHLCLIEIDHPATQRGKRQAAGAVGQAIHYLGADLAHQELGQVLNACAAFRNDAQTLFVAEGLLMYMPRAAVAALFAQMSAAAPASRLAFTWFEPQGDGQANFSRRSWLIDWWLKLRGEPFVSSLARADLRPFLAGAGFALQEVSDSADMLGAAVCLTLARDSRPIAGEYLCFASSVPSM